MAQIKTPSLPSSRRGRRHGKLHGGAALQLQQHVEHRKAVLAHRLVHKDPCPTLESLYEGSYCWKLPNEF